MFTSPAIMGGRESKQHTTADAFGDREKTC